MNEDPTRMMRRPDDHNPHGNMRLVVAGLVAVILGLVIAIAVISSGGEDDETGSIPATVTMVPPTETTETTEDTTADTTEETTSTETDTTETTPTDTTTTTTETTTAPEEEDDGSGGIEAP